MKQAPLTSPTRTILSTTLVTGILLSQGCSLNQSKKPVQPSVEVETPVQVAVVAPVSVPEPLPSILPPRVTTAKVSKQEIVKEHHNNVWPEIREKFQLAQQHMGRYDAAIQFYQKRKHHLEISFQRSEPYLYYIKTQIAQREMPMEFALLPLIESGFIPRARSHKKAVGLWQFIPSTGKMYGLEQTWWFDARSDLIKSTHAALDFLQDLHQQNNGDWLLALASYNAGYGSVLRAKKRYFKNHPNTPKDTPLSYWQLQKYLPKETAKYVPKLLATAHLVEFAKEYQIELHPVDNQPYFDVVSLDKQVSLARVATQLDISLSTLKILNPGYHRAATPPETQQQLHHLLLPVEKTSQFQQHFQKDPESFTVEWQRHKVKHGEYLGKIAQHYGTRVSEIKSLNGMRNSRIRANQILLIPLASATTTAQTARRGSQTLSTKKESHLLEETSFTNYSVQKGDSLWKVAQRYQISVAELKKWNQLKNDSLSLGQTLKIQSKTSKSAKTSDSTQSVANAAQVKRQHVVLQGEVLSVIAQQYGVSVQQLKTWNQLQSSMIRAGDRLTVWQGPTTSKHSEYQVKPGENLWIIAKKYQLTTRTLARYNALPLQTTLYPGQVLKIPYKG